jgi:hypothetical protein
MVFNKAGVTRKEEHHTILTLKLNCYSLQRTDLILNKLSCDPSKGVVCFVRKLRNCFDINMKSNCYKNKLQLLCSN